MSFSNSTLPPFILKVESCVKLDRTETITLNTEPSVVEEMRPHITMDTNKISKLFPKQG